MSNWTEDKVSVLTGLVGNEAPVSQETVEKAAAELEVSNRSVSSKLRKMGYDVEKVGARSKTFSADDESALVAFLEAHAGKYTYAEIAEKFRNGAFNARQVQGKVLSLDLTGAVAKTPPKETVKTYSDAEEKSILDMAANGAFLEDIAEAHGRTLASIRGKLLSLSRIHGIEIPKQRQSHAKVKVDPLTELGDISNMTVEEIANAIDKSPRGVRVMITHRGLECADYKAKTKKAE